MLRGGHYERITQDKEVTYGVQKLQNAINKYMKRNTSAITKKHKNLLRYLK